MSLAQMGPDGPGSAQDLSLILELWGRCPGLPVTPQLSSQLQLASKLTVRADTLLKEQPNLHFTPVGGVK